VVTKKTALALSVSLAAACTEPGEPPRPTGLDARELLVRASLDLRGSRPTADEIDRAGSDGAAAASVAAGFIDDPRFAATAASVLADAFRTRRDAFFFDAYAYGLDEERDPELQRAIANEVPGIVAYVAAADLPLTEILTADYTIVEPILLEVWPLEAVDPQPDGLPTGTVMARYADGRPPAGVLSTSSLWWRHTSTLDNANRGRTNAVTRALLCEDYLDRPIDFPKDVDLSDEEAIRTAVGTNEGCTACHATLDPFASHLWGFMQRTEDARAWARYHPEAELDWRGYSGASPAYFGVPTNGRLDTLAAKIASDDRFVSCAVTRVYERMLGRAAAVEDEGQLALHREAFLRSGLSLKALFKSVLGDPAYRGLRVESAYGGAPEPVTEKLLSPELMSSTVRDLSGFTLEIDGRDAVSVDAGLRALAGGSDRGANSTPSLGHALVLRRLAETAARSLARGHGAETRLGALLAAGSDRPDAELIAAVVLETRSRRVAADSDEVEALSRLWDSVFEATGDAEEATTALLTAALSDPELVLY